MFIICNLRKCKKWSNKYFWVLLYLSLVHIIHMYLPVGSHHRSNHVQWLGIKHMREMAFVNISLMNSCFQYIINGLINVNAFQIWEIKFDTTIIFAVCIDKISRLVKKRNFKNNDIVNCNILYVILSSIYLNLGLQCFSHTNVSVNINFFTLKSVRSNNNTCRLYLYYLLPCSQNLPWWHGETM